MDERSRREELLAGARAQLPLLAGVAPFALAYGAFAEESAVSRPLAQAMSAIIFGGASQLVAVRLIDASAPGIVVLLAVLLVNARHMLYSASMAPRVEHLPARWRWALAYLLTDEAYAVASARYEREGVTARAHWFFLGAGLALWLVWQAGTALGVFAGAAVPESWSLEFALPLTFLAILVPRLSTLPTVAAAAAALAMAVAGHGWSYGTDLVAAILAGIAAGMFAERLLTRGGSA